METTLLRIASCRLLQQIDLNGDLIREGVFLEFSTSDEHFGPIGLVVPVGDKPSVGDYIRFGFELVKD